MSAPCDAYADDWSALLDGELPAERSAELRAHLESCPRCTRQVEALGAADAALRAEAPPAEVPLDLRARLQARIDADQVTPLSTARQRRERRLGPPLSAGLLAAAAAAALYFAVARETPLPDEPAAPDTQVAGREPTTPPRVEPPAPDPRPEPPLQVAQEPAPAAAPTPEPAPETLIAAEPPTLADPQPAELPDALLEAASEEELAVALELETIEDLDVIANLELLEAILLLEEGTG